jgi:methionyl-tRNA formyltransferase
MKIIFMGTPYAAVPALARLIEDGHNVLSVYTQPDRPAGRGKRLTMSPVKSFAIENNIRVLEPLSLRTPEAIDEIRSFSADVAVVVAYGRILPAGFLSAFPKGAINVHFSLLPKYRGAAPVNWAIANGEILTGVTTMQMDEGLDTGDILLRSELPIGDEETSVELMERLSEAGADLLSETLTRLETLVPQPQIEAEATFAPIMKKADGLIDWDLSAVKITNRVRGFQPFPGSFSYFRGKRVVLWKTRSFVCDNAANISPGTIIGMEKDGLQIKCGFNTCLDVIEIQPEGKRRLAIREFINGYIPAAGEVFDHGADMPIEPK